MSERIWPEYCEDCYNVRPLQMNYSRFLVPERTMSELCEECLATRREDVDAGRPMREIGMCAETETQKWVDLNDIEILFRGGQPSMRAKVRAFMPTDMNISGIENMSILFRYKTEYGEQWLCGGFIELFEPYVRAHHEDYRLSTIKLTIIQRWSHIQAADVVFVKESASA